MNWGKGIALTLVAFAGMMAYFMVRGARSPEPLITENYYEQELKYQDQLDAMDRANALSARVALTADSGRITLGFPAEQQGKAIIGKLLLLRLNDVSADRTVLLNGTLGTDMQARVDLIPGSYLAQLNWTIDGAEHYQEEHLIVP